MYTNEWLRIINRDLVHKAIYQVSSNGCLSVVNLDSISVNLGLDTKKSSGDLTKALTVLSLITGQRPFITTAKTSIATWSLRKGQPIGCKVSLRKLNKFIFLEKTIKIALPRITEFNGILSSSITSSDAFGLGKKQSLSFGISDISLYPEFDLSLSYLEKVEDGSTKLVSSSESVGRFLSQKSTSALAFGLDASLIFSLKKVHANIKKVNGRSKGVFIRLKKVLNPTKVLLFLSGLSFPIKKV